MYFVTIEHKTNQYWYNCTLRLLSFFADIGIRSRTGTEQSEHINGPNHNVVLLVYWNATDHCTRTSDVSEEGTPGLIDK